MKFTRQRVAVHEAGHAMMSIITKVPFTKIEIRRGMVQSGCVLHPVQTAHTIDDATRLIISNAMVSLAGHIAEELFFNEKNDLYQPGNGSARDVADLFTELRKRLPENEICPFVSWIYVKTTNLLKKAMPQVCLIAKELQRRNTMTEEEVKKLIGAT